MDKEQLLASGLLEQYVLGLTDEHETLLVEEMAAKHEEIRLELSLLQQAMERYAAQHTFPADLPMDKNTSGQKEKTVAPKPQTGLFKFNGKTLWPLATAFALIWATYGALVTDIKDQQLRDLKDKFALLEKECENHRHAHQHLADLSSFIQHRHTYKVILKGCSISEGAFAIAYWNPAAQKGYIDTAFLPPPPKGKCYQLWADVDGHMVNAGLVHFDRNKNIQEVAFISNAASLNITLEPEGGSQEPSVELLQANGAIAMK
ncbi:MAG: anti-sigma factor [Saprospiraceae bacterium]